MAETLNMREASIGEITDFIKDLFTMEIYDPVIVLGKMGIVIMHQGCIGILIDNCVLPLQLALQNVAKFIQSRKSHFLCKSYNTGVRHSDLGRQILSTAGDKFLHVFLHILNDFPVCFCKLVRHSLNPRHDGKKPVFPLFHPFSAPSFFKKNTFSF